MEKQPKPDKTSKIYAFIDSTNLYMAIREQGWSLDYRRFRRYLSDKYSVSRALYFIGYMSNQRRLYESLRQAGYKLKFKPTSINKQGEVKGNVDAELILTAMQTFNQYDKAIIVGGDGDYYCLIKYLKRHNKLLKIFIPDRNSYSWLLRRSSEYLVFMNGMKAKLEYHQRKKERGIT